MRRPQATSARAASPPTGAPLLTGQSISRSNRLRLKIYAFLTATARRVPTSTAAARDRRTTRLLAERASGAQSGTQALALSTNAALRPERVLGTAYTHRVHRGDGRSHLNTATVVAFVPCEQHSSGLRGTREDAGVRRVVAGLIETAAQAGVNRAHIGIEFRCFAASCDEGSPSFTAKHC